MSTAFQVTGTNAAARFTLKVHRGDGMALLAMNWKNGQPPVDFVGFAIEYKEPGGDRFFTLKNRIAFPGADGAVNGAKLSSRLSPIQKFRWVHFPRNADLNGDFVYRVTPVFMNDADELSYGEPQEAAIQLSRETYPGRLNVTFTRGFVSSQAFVDNYGPDAIPQLLPKKADDGLHFVPSHPKAVEALAWMGFEARSAIMEVLDQAIADKDADVYVVAYDLSEREVVTRLQDLGDRLQIIIDDSGAHGAAHSAESQSAHLLKESGAKVLRQKMGGLQHNKTIVVDGPNVKAAVCGSTNFTWRGFFVQANNAIVVRGEKAIRPFIRAFRAYETHTNNMKGFGGTTSSGWTSLGLPGINARVSFSPHLAKNATLDRIVDDIADNTTSSLFYSLAFLFQTPGRLRDTIKNLMGRDDIFVYGISDKAGGGLDVQMPNGNRAAVQPEALTKNVPEPFKSEPTGLAGGVGNRMHHKFVVIDFEKPTARVYLGSYNFSLAADRSNGENLLVIRDRRIAVSYMIEALRLFDHYHFRVAQLKAKKARTKLQLAKPPRQAGDEAWWESYYGDPKKVRDREVFA